VGAKLFWQNYDAMSQKPAPAGINEFRPYPTNGLWLELASVTNVTGNSSNWVSNFIIHTTNTTEQYDIFGTTNLSPNVPGLNLTNWVWLLRTVSGETNIVITNNWPNQGFFVLGTTNDSDGDGLTDAYEHLVSHTDPAKWDTDGDGLSDGWEIAHGMNPNLDESAQTSGRINYLYDGSGWLQTVSGVWSESVTLDAEGNVLQLP
jgi:hypothetical protein